MVAAANEVMEAKKQQGLLGNGESSRLKSARIIWEPGGGEKQCEQPNAYVYDVMVAAANEVMEAKKQQGLLGNGESSRIELDSHANMAVVGRHCFVIRETGRQADVSPFSPEYESLKQVDIGANEERIRGFTSSEAICQGSWGTRGDHLGCGGGSEVK
jgi:hypothetical protein